MTRMFATSPFVVKKTGAIERIRTSMGFCPAATSRQCVYQSSATIAYSLDKGSPRQLSM